MDGLMYVIDELGRGMAQLKAEIARLSQENAALQERLAAATEQPKK
jgi:uncharacterized small protein (DUF1192 family)